MVLATPADTRTLPHAVRVAAGLEHVDGPASHSRGAIYYLASDVEAGKPASGLTEMTMRCGQRHETARPSISSSTPRDRSGLPFDDALVTTGEEMHPAV